MGIVVEVVAPAPVPAADGAIPTATTPSPQRAYVRLRLCPTTLRAANAYIRAHHRHSAPVAGCVAVVSVTDDSGLTRGVGVLGRPVARMLADGQTAEITRVCTDGAPNACSMIYSALTRAAAALGYGRVVTYTHADEPGTSVIAAGYRVAAAVRGHSWDRPSRRRPLGGDDADKLRWERST